MKKHCIYLIFFLSFSLISCESKPTTKKKELKRKTLQETIQEELGRNDGEEIEATGKICNILSKNYLLSVFPGAENFKPFSKEKPYPSCSYRFEYNGQNYKVGFTLVKKYASEKNLDKAVSYFKEKELLNGIGEKAYYIPQTGQVSLFKDQYLTHIFVTVNEKGNKNLAVKISKDLLLKIH